MLRIRAPSPSTARPPDTSGDGYLASQERSAANHLSDARAVGVPRDPDRSDDGGRACQICCRSSPGGAAKTAGGAEGPLAGAGGTEPGKQRQIAHKWRDREIIV